MARKEPASGIDFPEISTSPGLTPNLKLTGVGVRAKKLVGPVAVKVRTWEVRGIGRGTSGEMHVRGVCLPLWRVNLAVWSLS